MMPRNGLYMDVLVSAFLLIRWNKNFNIFFHKNCLNTQDKCTIFERKVCCIPKGASIAHSGIWWQVPVCEQPTQGGGQPTQGEGSLPRGEGSLPRGQGSLPRGDDQKLLRGLTKAWGPNRQLFSPWPCPRIQSQVFPDLPSFFGRFLPNCLASLPKCWPNVCPNKISAHVIE